MFSMGIMLMPTTMNATMVRMMENWENPCFFAPVSWFEIATLIKQLYPRLPEQVSYPNFSTNTSGEEHQTLISYTLNAPKISPAVIPKTVHLLGLKRISHS